MQAARNPHVEYLLAELGTLADELRRPTGSLTRSQLAGLADRARRDVAAITGAALPAPVDARPQGSGAEIIPLFAR